MRKNSKVCYTVGGIGNGTAECHERYYMSKKSVLQKIIEYSIVQLFKLRKKVDKRDIWGFKYIHNYYDYDGVRGEKTKISNYKSKILKQPFPFCELEEEDWFN